MDREKLINIAASIYNNIGTDEDMSLICLLDKNTSEKMVKKRKKIVFINSLND